MKTTWRIILKDIFGTLSSVGAWLRPCSKTSGACLLPFYLFTLLLLLSSCSGDDDGGGRQGADDMQTVRLYLNVPSSQASRAIGDPGEATGEGEDWDRLAVMIEAADGYDGYIVPGSRYYVEILSKEDFNRLDEESGSRWLPIDLIESSQIHIYGVTYSSDASENPENAINSIENNNSGSFANLEISNSYSATDAAGQNIDVAKFLSVATGYYKDNNGDLGTFTVEQPKSGISDRMPTMTLTRLAAKIDIQWDAEDAYELEGDEIVRYENVKVEGFTFYNNATDETQTDAGSGRLFPSIVDENATQLGGSKEFYNQSPVSQRNGRVYHYVFPDGVSSPKVTFEISAAEISDNTTTQINNRKYTFTFDKTLKKATWYKINTTISGLKGNINIDVSPDAGGGESTTTN